MPTPIAKLNTSAVTPSTAVFHSALRSCGHTSRFETSEVPGARVIVRARGLEQETVTDGEGHFQVRVEGVRLIGTTLDVSEGGMRVVFGDDVDAPPKPGVVADVQLQLGRGEVACAAEALQHFHREDRPPAVSFRFIDLPSKTEDLIRGEVFEELRVQQQRARGLI